MFFPLYQTVLHSNLCSETSLIQHLQHTLQCRKVCIAKLGKITSRSSSKGNHSPHHRSHSEPTVHPRLSDWFPSLCYHTSAHAAETSIELLCSPWIEVSSSANSLLHVVPLWWQPDASAALSSITVAKALPPEQSTNVQGDSKLLHILAHQNNRYHHLRVPNFSSESHPHTIAAKLLVSSPCDGQAMVSTIPVSLCQSIERSSEYPSRNLNGRKFVRNVTMGTNDNIVMSSSLQRLDTIAYSIHTWSYDLVTKMA